VCFGADARDSYDIDVPVTEPLQVAAAASRVGEDVTTMPREALLLEVSLGEMVYHFLAHTIDIKRSNLTDKLVAKDILSPDERQKIKELKKADAMVKSLLMILSQKSAAEFESFLTTLSETGQQSVVDVMRPVLCTVGQTGHNPLHCAYGMSA